MSNITLKAKLPGGTKPIESRVMISNISSTFTSYKLKISPWYIIFLAIDFSLSYVKLYRRIHHNQSNASIRRVKIIQRSIWKTKSDYRSDFRRAWKDNYLIDENHLLTKIPPSTAMQSYQHRGRSFLQQLPTYYKEALASKYLSSNKQKIIVASKFWRQIYVF